METVIQRLAKRSAPTPTRDITILPLVRREHEHGESCGSNCTCGSEGGGCCD